MKTQGGACETAFFFCFHCTCGGCWNQMRFTPASLGSVCDWSASLGQGNSKICESSPLDVCTHTKTDTQRHGHQPCIDRLDRPCNFADSSSPEAPPFWLVFINTRVSASLSRTLTSSGMIGNCGFHSHLWQLHQVSYGYLMIFMHIYGSFITVVTKIPSRAARLRRWAWRIVALWSIALTFMWDTLLRLICQIRSLLWRVWMATWSAHISSLLPSWMSCHMPRIMALDPIGWSLWVTPVV